MQGRGVFIYFAPHNATKRACCSVRARCGCDLIATRQGTATSSRCSAMPVVDARPTLVPVAPRLAPLLGADRSPCSNQCSCLPRLVRRKELFRAFSCSPSLSVMQLPGAKLVAQQAHGQCRRDQYSSGKSNVVELRSASVMIHSRSVSFSK